MTSTVTAGLVDRDRGLLWHPYAALDGPAPYAVSAVEGIRLRLDLDTLARLLRDREQPRVIVAIESIYSVLGDAADIAAYRGTLREARRPPARGRGSRYRRGRDRRITRQR